MNRFIDNFAGRVSTVAVYSRSSSPLCARRCLTLTVGCGLRTKKTSCTQIRTHMRPSVSAYFYRRNVVGDAYRRGIAAHSLNWYRFIGRILGKAMYEGILVDVGFAGFFLAKVNFDICSAGRVTKDMLSTSGSANNLSWMISLLSTLICTMGSFS